MLLCIIWRGGIHDNKEQRERDYNRDQIINSLGLRVLRIRNEELFNMHAVLDKIFAALNNP
jgi:very-short-patch-repair endonuclease